MVKLRTSEERDIPVLKELWKLAFGDEDAYIDHFFSRYYAPERMLVLEENGEVLAVTLGSLLSASTFDVHFEKARLDVEGAYTAINFEFARYLRQRYPDLRWLNREDDMGLEGLRKAKLSYCPTMLLEKYWARLWEDADEI